MHYPHAVRRSVVVLCLIIPTMAAAQEPAAPAVPLTYEAALQRAITANPTLVAARLKRSINLASRDVAGERQNPEFRFELAKETPKEGYTLAVPWETGGKRGKRIAAAETAIRTGDAELDALVAQIAADVRDAYFERFIAENRQTLLTDMQTLAQRARDAAQARFDTGDAPRLDLVQAQLEFADAQNQAAAAAGEVASARARLNALLGYDLNAAVSIAPAADVTAAVAVDAAQARARQANAELAVIDRRIDEQKTKVALAQAMKTPDLTPEGTLTHRAEPEFNWGWRAAVAITLPIFTTHSAGVRLEEATLTQLTSERSAAAQRIAGEVAAAAAIAEAQRLQYIRYRDEILPQAADVERMAEDAYRAGQTNLTAYLQALQSTRDVRLRALQAAADLQTALADLDRAVGAPLTPTTPPTP